MLHKITIAKATKTSWELIIRDNQDKKDNPGKKVGPEFKNTVIIHFN